MLLVLVLGSPASWAGSCALSASQKEEILAKLEAAATKTPYGNSWWPCDMGFEHNGTRIQERCKDFPAATKIRDLSTAKGELILFRGIGNRYVKRFTGDGTRQNFIVSEGNAYSYSLAPNIAHRWGAYEGDRPYTIIAIQNVKSDELIYPSKKLRENRTLRLPLEPGTLVEDIVYYDEVKVPVARENVVVAIPLSDFRNILDTFGSFRQPKGPYQVLDLLKKVLESPRAENPDCQETMPREVTSPAGDDSHHPGNSAAE